MGVSSGIWVQGMLAMQLLPSHFLCLSMSPVPLCDDGK